MKELDEYFTSLHKEIYRVRTVGYEHTDIISKSERFFEICDEATGFAEVYAQRKATSLATLEKFITADIVVLMLLIGYEFIKAVRFAAMNRILQHKAYLDNATGLPNKNKCEEILGELNPPEDITVCSFDLNNLRRINDSMGHDAGDAYIYRFAVCLRSSIPSEHFVRRIGGDEFIAVLQGLDKQAVRKLFEDLRKDIAAESKEHREIPLSYAAGFAMASDYPGKTMRELFNDADKNMYINKNHVKREEALEEKRLNYQLLKLLNQHGKNFLDCLYCDAKLDTYRVIRSSENFFLALDGAYSSAVEQIVQEKIGKDEQKNIRESLQITRLQEKMKEKQDVQEYQYDMHEEGFYKRMTLIPVDWDENKKLHHFLLAFEMIRKGADNQPGAREQLQIYYEQLKQSIIENDSYVDALLELSDVIYTVNLKTDILERNIILKGKEQKNKEKFDFSRPIGTNNGILTVRSDNSTIVDGNYSTYNGMRVALLNGSSRDKEFADFAGNKGFTYDPVYFDTTAEMEKVLQSGNVDAIAATSMRKTNNERIVDKFDSSDFYVIVKKGNTELLNEINYAIDQMNAVEGDWKTTLYNKNYESIETKNLGYTEKEKSIISQYSKDNPLHVLCDPTRYPYSYNENGEMKGIIPDYFRKIADYAGISYEFLTPVTRDEYIAYQKDKETTDMSIDARLETDNYAETNKWGITAPFITMQMVRVTRRDFDGKINVVATVDQTVANSIEDAMAPGAKKLMCSTRQEMMEAVRKGKADAAFVYYYMAQAFVNSDTTGTMTYTLLEQPTFTYRMVISSTENHALAGILTKAMYAMPKILLKILQQNIPHTKQQS